jgi:hypothetical protein
MIVPIPVSELSKARVCGRSIAGIAGSNPAGGIDVFLCCECRLLSCRGLSDGPMLRPRNPTSCEVLLCMIWNPQE